MRVYLPTTWLANARSVLKRWTPCASARIARSAIAGCWSSTRFVAPMAPLMNGSGMPSALTLMISL